MFQSYEETNTIWFRDDTFEDDAMYFLIGNVYSVTLRKRVEECLVWYVWYVLGVLCGLAIYNFTIINIPFPLAMYKKLLNEPVRLQDVKGLSPTLHKYVDAIENIVRCAVIMWWRCRSLEDVLNYNEADLEEVFSLHFDITREVFGEIKVIPLKPNGENIPVNLENKYVLAMVVWTWFDVTTLNVAFILGTSSLNCTSTWYSIN